MPNEKVYYKIIIGKKVMIQKCSFEEPLGAKVEPGNIVEVRGFVGKDLSINCHDFSLYGPEMDLEQHSEMVKYYQKFCKE